MTVNVKVLSYVQRLVGRHWLMQQTRARGASTWVDVHDKKTELEFSSNGGYTSWENGEVSQKGTYTADGQKIFVVAGSVKLTYYINNVSTDEAELAVYNEGENMPAYTVRVARMAETESDARRMIVGQWRTKHPSIDMDEEYLEFTADGKLYYIYKVKADAPDDEWYSAYRGQCVGYFNWNYDVEPKADGADHGIIVNKGRGDTDSEEDEFRLNRGYSYLTNSSVILSALFSHIQYVRADKKVEYKVIDHPWE